MLSGNNGILQRVTDAKTETERGEVYEQISLAASSGEMEYYSNGTDRITAYKNALLNGVNGIDRDSLTDNGSNLITGTVTTKSSKQYDFSIPVPVTDITVAEHEEKVLELTDVYAKLYDDGTLILSSTDYTDLSKNLTKDFGLVEDKAASNYWSASDYNTLVTKVIIHDEITPNSTAYWFSGLKNLSAIVNINKLETGLVTSMSRMFSQAGRNATTFDIGNLSRWNVSNVTDMTMMFNYAGYSATTFDIGNLSNWNVSNVNNMEYMFSNAGYNSTTWNVGNLSRWDTSKVEKMSYMFNSAGYNATTFDIGNLSNWNVSKVTNMERMFENAGSNAVTVIWNLSGWNTSKVNTMSYMFHNAGLKTTNFSLDISNWNTSNVKNMTCMFQSTGKNSTTFKIKGLSSWNVSNVTDMTYMFSSVGENATEWSIGDLSNWNISSVKAMRSMFHSAGKKATTWNIGDLSNWNTSAVTDMYNMFCYAGLSATTWNIGTLNIYANDISYMFYSNQKANCTLNIHSNPTSYQNAFEDAAASGNGIVINYSGTTTNIDNIIATKSSNSNVTKGNLLD